MTRSRSRARRALAAALLAASLAASAPALALTGCSLTGATGLSFGAYDPFSGAPLDTTGTVTLSCQNVVAGDTVMLDLSAGGAGRFSPRSLGQGMATLGYNVYLDAARTVVWGDGSNGTSALGPVTPSSSSNFAVYGRIPARQSPTAGSYGDTLVVTVLY